MINNNKVSNFIKAEYIWLDGHKPQNLRCKTKMVNVSLDQDKESILKELPIWNFDGSSTNQAQGFFSDCFIKPVNICIDPTKENGILVLCEVLNADGTPHITNKRRDLVNILQENDLEAYVGFEQEYTMFKNQRPLGWPKRGYPAPQGSYYCSVGSEINVGRELVEEHLDLCLKAGISIYGINAEVMLGQWEFQVGFIDESIIADPLTMSDQLWIARFLLYKLSEKYGIRISLECKPVKGDWNGAGMHTNFSTKKMREEGGIEVIQQAIKSLEKHHKEHIENYGYNLQDRLTGEHETAHIDVFTSDVAHRNASIRIPKAVEEKGRGYFEDRRPGADADPYVVSFLLIKNTLV